jgi:hypothetical protein
MLHGKQRGAGELMALNVFGDSTRSWQPCTSFLGSPSPPELEELPVIDLDLFAATQGLPSKVDWRSTNVVTYVKKWGPVGRSPQLLRWRAVKTKSTLVSLWALDCTYPYVDHRSNCSSGSRYEALALIKKVGGSIPSSPSTTHTRGFDPFATLVGFTYPREYRAILHSRSSTRYISTTFGKKLHYS